MIFAMIGEEMQERMATQIMLEFVRREAFTPDLLADAAESCLDALTREAQFVAFGPAVSADLEKGVIQVECTIGAANGDEVNSTAARIGEVALAALARSEYESSQATLEAIPA